MRFRVIFAIAVVLCFVGSTHRADAQQGNVLRGKVQLAPGKPLANIIVDLESGSGVPASQTTTSTEGDFAFGALFESSYIVVIREPDYQPVREEVNFAVRPDGDQPGESRFVTIQLIRTAAARANAGGTVFAQTVPALARDAHDRGARLARDEKHAEAIAAFREAIAAFPEYFDAHLALGVELMETGDSDASLREFEHARTINPSDARVFACFGQLLVRQRKLAVAAAAFGEAARLNPSDPQYPLQRAAVLIDRASSIDAFKPEDAKVRTELLEAASKDLDAAWERSRRSLAAVYLQRARLYERKGDRKAAAGALERYLTMTPNAPNADAIRKSIESLRSGS